MTPSGPARPPLDTDALRGLAGGRVRYDVTVVEATPSTNAMAAEMAHSGAGEGTVVVAEHQTAGRGRLDRVWETPARTAITVSVVFRPEVPPARWPWLPLLVGVAVARTLREASVPAQLKWPNDVLVHGRKIAGILVELVDTPAGPAAIAGVGLNVAMTADEIPLSTATSLLLEGVEVDRTGLLSTLLQVLGATYTGWLADPARLRDAYLDLCVTVPDQPVRADLPNGTAITGTTRTVDESGGLVVATDDGDVTVNAGDVVHLRPLIEG